MIKYLFLILLMMSTITFAQQKKLWIEEEVSETASGYLDSDVIDLRSDDEIFGDFNGLFCISLDIDTSLTQHGEPDSLVLQPMFKVNGTWYTGAIMQWDRFNTSSITGDIIDTNIDTILTVTYHDSLLIWVSTPSNDTTIYGIPIIDQFKLRCTWYSDSVDFVIDARLGRD